MGAQGVSRVETSGVQVFKRQLMSASSHIYGKLSRIIIWKKVKKRIQYQVYFGGYKWNKEARVVGIDPGSAARGGS